MYIAAQTGQCPADEVVSGGERPGKRRGVASDAQVDVECDGDCPQERRDAREDGQSWVQPTPRHVLDTGALYRPTEPPARNNNNNNCITYFFIPWELSTGVKK